MLGVGILDPILSISLIVSTCGERLPGGVRRVVDDPFFSVEHHQLHPRTSTLSRTSIFQFSSGGIAHWCTPVVTASAKIRTENAHIVPGPMIPGMARISRAISLRKGRVLSADLLPFNNYEATLLRLVNAGLGVMSMLQIVTSR